MYAPIGGPARLSPVIDPAATGRRIAELRRAAGLTVRELQERLGLSAPQAIYKWQRGEALPSLDNLAVLAAVLHARMDEIIVCRAESDAKDRH